MTSTPASQVPRAQLVKWACQARKALLGSRAPKAQLVHKGHRACKAFRASKGNKAPKVLLVSGWTRTACTHARPRSHCLEPTTPPQSPKHCATLATWQSQVGVGSRLTAMARLVCAWCVSTPARACHWVLRRQVSAKHSAHRARSALVARPSSRLMWSASLCPDK